MHDQLWGGEGQRESDLTKLRRANRLFRHAMWELGVPWLRRWLMWAAVTLAMFGRSDQKLDILRLLVWPLATAITVAALFARSDWTMDWPTAVVVAVSAAGVAVVAVLTALIAYLVSESVKGEDPKRQWRDMATSAMGVSVAVSALTVLVLFACAGAKLHETVGPVTLAASNGWLVIGLGVLGLVVWGQSAGAGVIATIALLLLALPLVGVGAALLVYAILELLALAGLALGRQLRRIKPGSEPRGPLNPMMKGVGR